MILARLVELYERLAREGLVEEPGFERKAIAYLLVLDADGRLVDVLDTREAEGPNKRGRAFRVPQGPKRAAGIEPALLWDNAEYVLGLPRDAAAPRGSLDKVAARHRAFRDAVLALPEITRRSAPVAAVLTFLDRHDPEAFATTPFAARFEDRTANLSFVIETDPSSLVCDAPDVRAALAAAGPGAGEGQCLVTGSHGPLARLHPAFKGVVGGQTSGVSLVSFNNVAFESYGLKQGDNAPVGTHAAFAYGTALNWLLSERGHRLRLGQLTVVAWADEADPAENLFDLFGEPVGATEEDRSRRVEQIKALLDAPRRGRDPAAPPNRLHVLGLAPNAARVAVALWQEEVVEDVVDRVRAWFGDLALSGRPPFVAEPLPLGTLLRALAPLGELDRLPPRLPAALLRAALFGGRLPEEALALALLRLRAPRRADAPYALTALIRALLTRNHAMEAPVSLDLTATDAAYRWGRLFAVYEKAQADAQPGIEATIRDRFWGGAAATPQLVFATLNRLNGHHLRKLEPRARIPAERLIGEILGGVHGFPARLPLPEQGRFALGYWHQRAALFAPRAATAAPPAGAEDAAA